ncbi:MAG: rhodanese-like domain-containing protein, partial [Alphaproteobacteria bacterium]|nr:rhodanese-like domain-containing protein [Alphaproteobacteria bacterium]
ALAAKTLKDMGIANVANLAGGFPAWVQAGGPTQG